MTCYRVVRRKYADLTGQGARLYGGRFNPPGIPAVYSSKNIALALLEILVHVDKPEVPSDYIVMAMPERVSTTKRRSSRHRSAHGHSFPNLSLSPADTPRALRERSSRIPLRS